MVASNLKTAEMNPITGRFIFQYDTSLFRVWDSANKQHLITPYNYTGIGYDFLLFENNSLYVPYTGQETVWVEGISPGAGSITLVWQPLLSPYVYWRNWDGTLFAGEIKVNVWGIDLDIDSDNDNGFNYPEGDDWEETLEDSPYGLGKLIYEGDTHFVPVRVRLPAGLNLNDPAIRIHLEYNFGASNGILALWNGPKASLRILLPDNESWSLEDLKYDTNTGAITLWAEAEFVSTFYTLQNANIDGNRAGDIVATLEGVGIANLRDAVKYNLAKPKSFYQTLAEKDSVRNGLASAKVYEPSADAPEFALKLQTRDEVAELLKDSDLNEVQVDYVLAVLFGALLGGPYPGPNVGALKAALYMDYAAPKQGEYVLAFAGTQWQNFQDILTSLNQFESPGEAQYVGAVNLGGYLARVPKLQGNLMVTGHSLGGGLATAAAFAGNIPADTFNSAGVQRHSLCETMDYVPGPNGNCAPLVDQASLDRFDSGGIGLINSYQVWWSIRRTDGTSDVPDLLSLVQSATPGVPKASGFVHYLEGLHNFTTSEWTFTRAFETFLTGVDISDPNWVNIVIAAGTGLIGGSKMMNSHVTESYLFGLLHDDATGWNAYDSLNSNVGPN